MDGCSRMGVLWRIVLPLSLPALVAVCGGGLLRGVERIPLRLHLHLTTDALRVRYIGLASFIGELATPVELVLAGATVFTVAPVDVLPDYAALNRQWPHRRRGEGLSPPLILEVTIAAVSASFEPSSSVGRMATGDPQRLARLQADHPLEHVTCDCAFRATSPRPLRRVQRDTRRRSASESGSSSTLGALTGEINGADRRTPPGRLEEAGRYRFPIKFRSATGAGCRRCLCETRARSMCWSNGETLFQRNALARLREPDDGYPG